MCRYYFNLSNLFSIQTLNQLFYNILLKKYQFVSFKARKHKGMQAEEPRIFTLMKWNAVASWVSDSQGQTCSICKE